MSEQKLPLDSRPQPDLNQEQLAQLNRLAQIQPERVETLQPHTPLGRTFLRATNRILGGMRSSFRTTAEFIAPDGSTDQEKDHLAANMLIARLNDEVGMGARFLAKSTGEAIGLKVNPESMQAIDEAVLFAANEYGGAIIATMHTGGLKAGTIELPDHLPSGSEIDMIVESAGDTIPKIAKGKAIVRAHTVGKPADLLQGPANDSYDKAMHLLHAGEEQEVNARRIAAVRQAVGNFKQDNENGQFLLLAVDRPELAGSTVDVAQFNTVRRLPSSPAKLSASTGRPVILVYPRITNGELHIDVGEPIMATSRDSDSIQAATQTLATQMEQLVRAHPDQWVVNRPIDEIWPYAKHEE